MELKRYQKEVLEQLGVYLKELHRDGPKKAFNNITPEEASKYKDSAFGQVPFVCIKIPTGGGKTVVAAHVVEKIMDATLSDKLNRGIVLWFTPTDAIQTQTLKKLKDRKDWHRRILDEAFDRNVKVFSNEEALTITKGDISDNLCVIVASLDAFRKDKTKQSKYKVYKENGALIDHFNDIRENDFLQKDEEGTVINSLANVIIADSPLIVIDEGHHTQTDLSVDVLKALNPRFVVEFTATPRKGSNILVDIPASDLKAEEMVKIPLVLASLTQWQTAVQEGIVQRNELEKSAKKLKEEYIRPIALLQAQSDRGANSVTVEVLKNFLLEQGIHPDEIAIKVSSKDELEGKDLFSKKCPIKYIITVNALAEGWDCSFAYVLISVANLGARVSVEQIIGRIIRMPNGKKKTIPELNESYVFASAKNFQEAASNVINSLQSHGYSAADVVSVSKKNEPYELEVPKAIKAELKVPHVALGGGKLSFEDFVENFILAKQDSLFDFKTHYDSDGKAILDLDENNEWTESKTKKLDLQYHDKNYTKQELVQWLGKKLRFPILEKSDKDAFIEKALTNLLKKYNLTELSVNRFVLANRFSEVINQLIEKHAQKEFDKQLKNKKITVKGFNAFPSSLILKKPVPKEFNKNLYERIDPLNSEERQFADRIDLLSDIKFWVRNQEKAEWFYVQGWKKGKFYPDFVVVTKKGNTVALEWKGEDRVSNDDTKYKEEVGNLWAKLGGGKLHFWIVTNKNIEEVLTRIEKL